MHEPHYVEAWEPTPKQYAAYRKREFALAKQNIERLAERFPSATPTVDDTLHSLETFESAYASFVVERA